MNREDMARITRRLNGEPEMLLPSRKSSHAKEGVLEIVGVEPNSKMCEDPADQEPQKSTSICHNNSCLNIEESAGVLEADFGRQGCAVGDISGFRLKIVKVANVYLFCVL